MSKKRNKVPTLKAEPNFDDDKIRLRSKDSSHFWVRSKDSSHFGTFLTPFSSLSDILLALKLFFYELLALNCEISE